MKPTKPIRSARQNNFSFVCLTLFLSFSFSLPKFCFSQESIIETTLENRPGVVSIRAMRIEAKASAASPFLDMRQGKMFFARKVTAATLDKYGAGVIVHPDGYFVTNFHVVYQSNKVFVKLNDDTVYFATIVSVHPDDDLALLKISSDKQFDSSLQYLFTKSW